ncbi:adenylate, partial [Cystoisospora suis]
MFLSILFLLGDNFLSFSSDLSFSSSFSFVSFSSSFFLSSLVFLVFLFDACVKETSDRFLASGLAKVSKFGLFSPLDVDKMVMPGSLERPVLLNDRIYYPGAREEDVKQFCLYPSLYLSSSLPSPSQCLPRCAFLGPPLSGKTTIARLIADWCGAVYVSPEKAVKKCLDIPKSSSRLIQRALHELRRGRRVPSCCLVRLIHQRLRQLDTLQKGYILDGFPRHLAHAKRLQALDSYHRIEISSSSSFSLEDQHEHSPSSSLSTTPDQSPSHRKERKEEEEEREGRRERSQSALELSRDRDLGFRGVATGKREEEDTEEEEDERGRRGEEERKITKGGERHSIAFGEKTGASMKYRDMLKDVFLVEQKRKKEEEERKRRKERKLEEEKIKKEKGKNDDEIEEEEEESEGSSRDEENEEDKEEEEKKKKKEGVLERKTRSLDVTKKREEEEEEFGEKESVMKKSAKPRPHTSALEESSGTSQPWNEEEKEEEREKRKIERKGRANTISLGEKEEEEEENTSRYTRHTTAGIDLQEIQEEKKKKKKTSASSPSFEKEGNEDLPIPSDGESQERCENEKEEEGEQERKKKEEETSREDRGNSTTKERREEEEDEARDESVNREDRGKEKEEESDREENKKKKGESHPHDEKRQKNEKKKEEEENKKEKNARMKKKKKFVARTPEELQAHREEKKKRRIDRELETIHVDASLPENDEEESAIDLIFILQSNYVQTLQRAKDIALEHQKNFYCGDERDVQRTLACHDRTWREYQRDLPSIQSYYSHTYNNVILIPSEKSVWEQFEIARKEILSFVHRKHSYLRRKAEGKACHSFLLGRNRRKTLRLTSTEFSTYCPVCWTIHGSLVEAGGIFVYQVDYQEKVYLCCTRTHLEVFLKSPDVYLREAIPETLPRRLTLLEISHLLSSSSPLDLSINGYCPVALVEEKKYLKGNASTLLVSYDSRYWTFTSQDALETFMKFPASYAQLAVLPPKLEAEDRLGKKPRTLQSIAEEGEKQTPPLHSLSSLANELKDAFTFLE